MPETPADDKGNAKFENPNEQFESFPEAWEANVKRTYDEFQDLSLSSARRSQVAFDALQNVALQALQNAVTTANVVNNNIVNASNVANLQAIAHRDIAVHHEWFPDPDNKSVTSDD